VVLLVLSVPGHEGKARGLSGEVARNFEELADTGILPVSW
jgi:hypothetical protein